MRLIGIGLILGFAMGGYVQEISFAKRLTSYQVDRHYKAERR